MLPVMMLSVAVTAKVPAFNKMALLGELTVALAKLKSWVLMRVSFRTMASEFCATTEPVNVPVTFAPESTNKAAELMPVVEMLVVAVPKSTVPVVPTFTPTASFPVVETLFVPLKDTLPAVTSIPVEPAPPVVTVLLATARLAAFGLFFRSRVEL